MSTRISQGNFKSHVCTVKVSRMGLFADRGSVRSKTVRFSYINVLSLKNMVYSAQQILLMFVKDFFLKVAQKKGCTKRTHQIAGFETMM